MLSEPDSVGSEVIVDVPEIQHDEHDHNKVDESSIFLSGRFTRQDRDMPDLTGRKRKTTLVLTLRNAILDLVDALLG
jgi:hypothetical protein